MPNALMVYVPQRSLPILDWGLSHGRWAFPLGVQSTDLQHLAVGDLVFFGAGGRPRQGGKLPGWMSRSLSDAHIARVVSPPYDEPLLFWPDEIEAGTAKSSRAQLAELDLARLVPFADRGHSPREASSF
jgi:hypothetical protein